MKRLAISMLLALMLVLAVSTVALADDVMVSAVSNGGPGSDVTVVVEGIDTSTWNPGVVAQTNTFNAQGAFQIDYSSHTGNYGSLNSLVNATGSAAFTLTDVHDFDILSANHNYGTVGTFTAFAAGSNAQMNIDNHGSMYLFKEHTDPYWAPELQGEVIWKNYDMLTNGNRTASMYIGATMTDGLAWMDNSSQWGFGSSESGSIGAVTDTVTATGSGTYRQYIAGVNSSAGSAVTTAPGVDANINAVMPVGGSLDTIINFLSGFQSLYSMSAN